MSRARCGTLAVALSIAAWSVAGCNNTSPLQVVCGPGTHEVDGVCEPLPVQQDAGAHDTAVQNDAQPATGLGQVGDPCTTDADCDTASGTCATTSLDPRLVGGYCTRLGCTDTAPCPAGSLCFPTGLGINGCFRFCEPGHDVCRTGYACQPNPDDLQQGFCAPRCAQDDDCLAGSRCDTTQGICLVPSECDPANATCDTGRTCFPTTLSPQGGYCLPTCVNRGDCIKGEVCQPLGPGTADGVCAPPPCAENADCPAGAVCDVVPNTSPTLNYCRPPDICSDNLPCPDTTSFTCVGGLCLSNCDGGTAGDAACQAIHPGLTCADSFGVCMPACGTGGACDAGNSCFTNPGDEVCLPTGSFPGSPCATGDVCAPVNGVDQVCVPVSGGNICVVSCAANGESDCAAVSATLTCVDAQQLCAPKCVGSGHTCDAGYACLVSENACLPTGSFPGSPCKGDGTCDDVGGRTQQCVGSGASGVCAPTCTADSQCTAISSLLTCVEAEGLCVEACQSGACSAGFACLASENACLPTGSFPGSPCQSGDLCDPVGGLGQACVDTGAGKVCVPQCATDAQCQGISSLLTCVEAEGLCLPECQGSGHTCDSGYSCFLSENACLPTGSFPGSPCAANNECHAVGAAVQTCIGEAAGVGQCAPQCKPGDATMGDALCRAVNTGLKCMANAESTPLGTYGGICVYACIAGGCDHLGPGYSCLASQQVCLPTGSFPSSPCLPAGGTHGSPWCLPVGGAGSLTQSCVSSLCVPDCVEASGGDALCAGIDPSLTCMPGVRKPGDSCVYACSGGACPSGYSCFEPTGSTSGAQNACLPTGSFPGGPCRSTTPACDDLDGAGPLPAMQCSGGLCVQPCTTDAACQAISSLLTCEESITHLCVPACVGAGHTCDTGYYCSDPAGQNACLPVGSIPGGPCRAANDPRGRCDRGLSQNGTAFDLGCFTTPGGDLCLIECGSDALCDGVSQGSGTPLSCFEQMSPTWGACLPACTTQSDCGYAQGNTTGYACFTQDGVCLPVGAFPGSPCANNSVCGAVNGLPQTCIGEVTSGTPADGQCAVQCVPGDATQGTALCQAVELTLTCMDSAESSTGGICVPACIGGTCDYLGAPAGAYSCFTQENACLPTGAFPGSPCRTSSPKCDDLDGAGPLPRMQCLNNQCVPVCTGGVEAYCTGVSATLTCVQSANDICAPKCGANDTCDAGFSCMASEGACLPTGSFPGGPCHPVDPTHAQAYCLDLVTGVVTQSCLGGICVIDCTDDVAGEAVCGGFGLTCMPADGVPGHAGSCVYPCAPTTFACPSGYTCFDPAVDASPHQNACLPNGSFPGSPCRSGTSSDCDTNLRGNDAYDMACFPSSASPTGLCLLTCTTDALCAAFDPSLTCLETQMACVKACVGAGHTCDAGFECFDPAGQNACLPAGSFPGAACGGGVTCATDFDGKGHDLSCLGGTCAIDCVEASGGDQLCQAFSAALTCMPGARGAAGDACVYACVGGACPSGYSCFEPTGTMTGAQNACLPDGSFPGSKCAGGTACGKFPGSTTDMTCAAFSTGSVCVVACDDSTTGDADCAALPASPPLTCVPLDPATGLGICTQSCASDACVDGRNFCYDPPGQAGCLPKGTMPFEPCGANGFCATAGGNSMTCHSGVCLVDCTDPSGDSTTCPDLAPILTCEDTFTHACVPACSLTSNCAGLGTGYSCQVAQDACLPDGTFPGSNCRLASPQCDSALGGDPSLNLVCVGGTTCEIDCNWNASVCLPFGLTCTDTGDGYACE